MEQDPGGKAFAQAVIEAAEHPHSPGVILQTNGRMAAEYLALYGECTARHA